ncbi:hypothetical protein BE15_02020 [Sorangium cellulosum]|uniref:Bro-N domain-containing protein n=2 Tax=Sorangium cellulosum TaxID=56 RepID=A0A150QAJ9_SORCE|nr:hypothetical protein BE15_02020 [Sorangium cellulosum]
MTEGGKGGVSGAMMQVTTQFEGSTLTTYVFRGRLCMVAADVGEALGYADGSFKKVLRDWSDELIAGQDIDTLTGDDLRQFKEMARVGNVSFPSSAPSLTVLYEPGVNLACVKTEKPLGRKLRRLLADEVLPKLRRGELQQRREAPIVLDDAESQVRLLGLRQREALSLYAVIPGLYDPEFLRHKTEHAAALVTGDAPMIENPLLDVSGYLQSRGVGASERKKMGGQFGKKLKAAYVAKHGEEPGKLPRDVNGGSREVLCYTERDRPLFDRVFAEMFGAAIVAAASGIS